MPNIIDDIKKEILEKKFKKNHQIGYDPDDVDEFFDKIILLLNKIDEILLHQMEKNESLESELNEAKTNNDSLSMLITTLNKELDALHKDGYTHNRINKRVADIEDKLDSLIKKKKNEN
jgi:DivIVA domain-containing protein